MGTAGLERVFDGALTGEGGGGYTSLDVPIFCLVIGQDDCFEALPRRPLDIENIDSEVLEELRRWGMVMPKSLELTGMGARYAGGSRGGVLE